MFASKDIFLKSSGGYTISRSVRLRSSASAYFNRTTGTPTSNTTWTFSAWIKRGTLGGAPTIFCGGSAATTQSFIYFNSSDQIGMGNFISSVYKTQKVTTQVFRDLSAWYHVVFNSNGSSSANIYVNGVQVTSFASNTGPDGSAWVFNSASTSIAIGRDSFGASGNFDGYLTEINFIDGQALTPSSFGSTNAVTGVWQPIKYAGTYGTNGFYLNFSDNSSNTATTIGKDYSGNGNNWTPNNISVTAGATYDSMTDVPTLTSATAANYAVLNPLDVGGGGTFSDGNLKLVTPVSNYGTSRTSFSVSSGKWYWEVTMTTAGSGDPMIGIVSSSEVLTNWVGNTSTSYSYNQSTGKKFNNGTSATYGASYTNGDVIGVALDLDSGTITFYKNNTSQGTAYTGLSGTFAPAISDSTNSFSSTFTVNFGQQGFTYTPPTGFVALNTQNLPTPTISNGANYMAASLFTGTSGNVTVSNAVNGISFQPDFLWFKARSNAQGHSNVDSVRGASKLLQTNLTNAESTLTNPPTFNTDGFTSTTDIHTNGYTYVAWQWKAGGSSSSNTSGSITSTVSAGATQGFSVVTWAGNSTSGATIGHGLGVAPSLLITKSRTNASSWIVGIGNLSGFGVNDYLTLNTTDAKSSSSTFYQAYGSSTFTVGVSAANEMNKTGNNYVTYAFSAVKGYSAFGSYTGNGSTDGTFVYTGFRPRWIMIKRTDLVANWTIIDTSMSPYNVTDAGLLANSSGAQSTGAGVGAGYDILSNGFKARLVVANEENVNGATMIYVAFAENPFKYSLAR